MLMVIFIKENGEKIWQMVKVHLWIPQELNILENGLMINSMDMVKKAGIMVKQGTQVNFIKEKRMERENLSGKMEAITMETSLMDFSKDMESTILLI